MSEENIKAALEYAVNLREEQDVVHHDLNGKIWVDSSKGNLRELEPIKYANSLVVNSLSGVIGFIKSKFDYEKDEAPEELLIHIESETSIKVLSKLDGDRRRENIISAEAILDDFEYGEFMDPETFNINILSLFARTDDAEAILKCASSVRIENSADLKDDGITQQVTVKKGAQVMAAEVPSPAVLRPYRTFLEVVQPESQFVFRINGDGDCALFEADGGLWKYHAMVSIKEYLEEALEEEIVASRIKIIA